MRIEWYQGQRRLLETAKRQNIVEQFYADFHEELKTRKAHQYSLRMLFEHMVDGGRELVDSWRASPSGGGINLSEATDGVSTAAFVNITGQIIYSQVMDTFNRPEFLSDKVCTTVPTQFDGEKIAGIGQLGDQADTVLEAEEYPYAGVSEEWVDTPRTVKRGFIVPVTKEAIAFDRTGLVLRRASDVSYWLAVNKEKRVLDAVLGISTLYRRNGGAAQATYGDTHTNGDFDNLCATNALVDWTDIENAELLFDGMTDPNTGEPIMVTPNQLIVPTALKKTAQRVCNATEIRFGDGSSSTTQTISAASNVQNSYEILSSQYVKARTSSATTWFIGDFKRAFYYMENWGITSVPAPANSHDEFHRDIVNQFKVSERGAAHVQEPRYAVKCTA